MKFEGSVAKVKDLTNMIRNRADSLFKMIRVDVKEGVGKYLSELMQLELSHFLGRGRYRRCDGRSNHRNGHYSCHFVLKGI